MIYLDHNATTPVRPEVAAAMGRVLVECPGNPSSVHAAGRQARQAVELARGQVSSLLDVLPEEIVFVSSGTEGDNQAVRGLAGVAAARGRPQIVSAESEHPAVRASVAWLQAAGHEVGWVPLAEDGQLRPGALAALVGDRTGLITLGLANHEIGNTHPLAEVVELAHARGALVHTDAVQAVGKMPVSLRRLGVDAATLSAHKLGGPKGVAAVFVRRGLDLPPLLAGGHQERERHPGTENVPAIVGFGVAAEACARALPAETARLGALRDALERGLGGIAGVRFHGTRAPEARSPATVSVAFAGAPAQLVVIALDLEGICVSTGAACTSGSPQPSPVLRALGLSEAEAREGVRISLGWTSSAADIEGLLRVLPEVVARVRAAARVHPAVAEPAAVAKRAALARGGDA